MEGIHGVDVSWLHHSNDYNVQKVSPAKSSSIVSEKLVNGLPQNQASQPDSPSSNGAIPIPNHKDSNHHDHLHLHHHHGTVSDQTDGSSPLTPTKQQKPASPGRKSSWVTSLSSKFSASALASSQSPTRSPDPASAGKGSKTLHGGSGEQNSQGTASSPSYTISAPSPNGKEDKRGSDATTTSSSAPASPKREHGFLSNAMRRLSSSGGSAIGKQAGSGGVCARRTMNIDPYRERCAMPELKQRKLMRVSFCVDVEIAGAAQYQTAEGEEALTNGAADAGKDDKSRKDRKKEPSQQSKQKEGEALKHGNEIAPEKDPEDTPNDKTEPKSTTTSSASSTPQSNGEPKETSKKKEKKKRSESERKERKEKKRMDALANGDIPAEIYGGGGDDEDDNAKSSSGGQSPTRSQDRPTTDPLRIYRRCCQLRETPMLRRVAEQISLPSASPVSAPGVLSVLDLSGYWLQLPDVITLGDYLAVVPVRKLILDNCGLGDEALRIILSGLLAAKTPEQAKFNRKLGKKHAQSGGRSGVERLGIIEKLSLKNNAKIGIEGWRHIALFINMSQSLTAIDISMVPFPSSSGPSSSPPSNSTKTSGQLDMSIMLGQAIGTRPSGKQLEELVLAECKLNTENIRSIVDGAIQCGLSRLGLANNNMTAEGLQHVLRYLQSGKCEGLDIGGNDLRDRLDDIATILTDKDPLFALSLAGCNLVPSSLENLLPALISLPNFRFIDLSHNRGLFSTKPSVCKLLRQTLPQFPILKRIHLQDVAMTPEHAIALAETAAESKNLAHINILDNHLISPLADARTETAQEEACALYASFMVAVRVSQSIICVDIDVPSPESSEIVKALAKQVVAYSLRNMEALPLKETSVPAIAAMTEPHGGEKTMTAPDILMHLVGHIDGVPENHDNDEPAPDNDYIVGGTGIVKALDICLNRAADGSKKEGSDALHSRHALLQGETMSKGKAKDMSKNLLDSARKIRARLQPALAKEAKEGNETSMSYRRLLFLDSTLQGMIQRFEDEYPETRLVPVSAPTSPASQDLDETNTTFISTTPPSSPPLLPSTSDADIEVDVDDNPGGTASPLIRPPHRASSSTSLSQAQAQEEALMHRFGQQLRRSLLRPQTEDHAHGTTGKEPEAAHLTDLRRRLEQLGGTEIRESVARLGVDGVLDAIGASAEELERAERRGALDSTSSFSSSGTKTDTDTKLPESDEDEAAVWRAKLEELRLMIRNES